MDERFATQAQIENDTRAYELQCAKFDEEVNTAKAQGIPFFFTRTVSRKLPEISRKFSKKLTALLPLAHF